MTDISLVLPDFPVQLYARLIPSLEKSLVTTTDLITLEASEIARRAHLPLLDLKRLCDALLRALQNSLGVEPDAAVLHDGGKDNISMTRGVDILSKWKVISTLDDRIDAALGGGIPTGYVTEVTGESGAGKTQFLLTLLLSSQLPAPYGLSRSALYISTESALPTSRLSQMLKEHSIFSRSDPKPTLDRIISIVTPDLESQDHILRFQVPVAIAQYNVGLIILDSVAANYRAEFERPGANRNGANMAKRSAELAKLGALLRSYAQTHNIAVVVSNQVSDRFMSTPFQPSHYISQTPPHPAADNSSPSKHVMGSSPLAHRSMAPPPPSSIPPSSLSAAAELGLAHPMSASATSHPNPMTLDHQQRWFTGWGDDADRFSYNSPDFQMLPQKTPSLGLVWTSQISARIALIKTPVYSFGKLIGDQDEVDRGEAVLKNWRRYCKVVFGAWCKPSGTGIEGAVEFEIGKSGISSIETVKDDEV